MIYPEEFKNKVEKEFYNRDKILELLKKGDEELGLYLQFSYSDAIPNDKIKAYLRKGNGDRILKLMIEKNLRREEIYNDWKNLYEGQWSNIYGKGTNRKSDEGTFFS